MEYVVEGQTISTEELSDASWQTHGYCAQERRQRELQNQGKSIVDPTAAHRPHEIVPHLFHHSKAVTARTTAVTGPDLAPGAQYAAELNAESADLTPTHGDRDPVLPFEPLQDLVHLAKALEQYLRR
ncbi:hypothetical protein HPB50_029138 [Hyalomma asiaticum]|nr:hypothetical protein HPB50_029138 [Hyalomma asiaticum]